MTHARKCTACDHTKRFTQSDIPEANCDRCGEATRPVVVDELAELRAENERLRETLRTIGQLAKDKESQGEVMIALAVRETLGEQ